MTNFNRYLIAFLIFITTRYGMVQTVLMKPVNAYDAVVKSIFFALALYLADTYMPPKSRKEEGNHNYLG